MIKKRNSLLEAFGKLRGYDPLKNTLRRTLERVFGKRRQWDEKTITRGQVIHPFHSVHLQELGFSEIKFELKEEETDKYAEIFWKGKKDKVNELLKEFKEKMKENPAYLFYAMSGIRFLQKINPAMFKFPEIAKLAAGFYLEGMEKLYTESKKIKLIKEALEELAGLTFNDKLKEHIISEMNEKIRDLAKNAGLVNRSREEKTV